MSILLPVFSWGVISCSYNFCNELALMNANDVILQFEVIISCRAVNISSFIFINEQPLCTSRRHLAIASEFFTGYFA